MKTPANPNSNRQIKKRERINRINNPAEMQKFKEERFIKKAVAAGYSEQQAVFLIDELNI